MTTLTTRCPDVRFTIKEAQQAADDWNFNCGPGALCAVLGKTPAEIRPHLLGFEKKGYTNPTLMSAILRGLGVTYREIYKWPDPYPPGMVYPLFGLVRIQWDGPWCNAGVPMAARYRHTHWIGMRQVAGSLVGLEVFDINAMYSGGWIRFGEWRDFLVPWLLREIKSKGNGKWWPTHCWEI